MSQPNILYGLETEYGISREDPAEDHDVVAESIALVRAAREDGVHMRWDYGCEDPHIDARGFRVDALRQDVDEANYFAQDAARPMSFSEIKSDLALRNGARFYNDHAHPEYCTPECATIQDLLIQDQLGDQLVMGCAQAVWEQNVESPEGRVRLYKNNTDFLGHSYGCHENYLVKRALPWRDLSEGMLAFLITRQIFCGAGKFAFEKENRYVGPGFQISQRGDFFSVIESVDTMQKRPIVNTRDEPHANPKDWRRFHVICGDANLSPFATYLKVGTAAAVLRALSAGLPCKAIPRLHEPVRTIRDLSRDTSWRWECQTVNGQPTTAIEIQRAYLKFVEETVGPSDDGFDLADWEAVLNDLERDPSSTADRLDWSSKHKLIEQFRQAENVDANNPWLMSLDLAYHLLDRDDGLFLALRDQGSLRSPPGHLADPERAWHSPAGTRARIRGLCIERFGHQVASAQWDHVRLHCPNGLGLELDLRDLFQAPDIEAAEAKIRAAEAITDLYSLPFAKPWKSD